MEDLEHDLTEARRFAQLRLDQTDHPTG